MLYKRLTTPYSDIPWGPFQLGRFGTPMTIFSIAYTFVAMFFSFWPSTSVVNAASMNYSIVIYAGAFAFSTAFWFLHGRRVYKGPIWEFEDRDRN
jgi:choline transport protein